MTARRASRTGVKIMVRIFTPKTSGKPVAFSVVIPVNMNDELEKFSSELEIKKTELVRQMLQHCLDDLVTMEVAIGGTNGPENDS
jgi:hypothetical protein